MPPEFVPEVEWAETEADDTDANDDDEAAAADDDDDELAAIEELTESRMVVSNDTRQIYCQLPT
jgi:hypothetical protein